MFLLGFIFVTQPKQYCVGFDFLLEVLARFGTEKLERALLKTADAKSVPSKDFLLAIITYLDLPCLDIQL
jgi:hypothetical protein